MVDFSDVSRVGFRQVSRTRPWAVCLAIALGITAFIVLAVLGQEIRHKLSDDFLLMGGVNVLEVDTNDDKYPGSPQHIFSRRAVDEIRRLPGVKYASASTKWSPGYIQPVGNRKFPLQVIGIDQYFILTNFLDVEAGRNITGEEVENGERVALLGHLAACELYGSPEKAIGKYLSLSRNDTATVVGVVNGMLIGEHSSHSFMPYTVTMNRRLASAPGLDRIYVYAEEWEKIPALGKEIERTIHKINNVPHLAVRYSEEQFKRIDQTFFWLSTLLWMSIVLALMLGGFGIWSGTFSSVRGRTQEIGLKKAMGATNGDIMLQFLLEALYKAVIGGVMGLLVGSFVVVVGIHYLQCPFPFARLVSCALVSLAFSIVLGIGGGLFPALKASHMDVVDSLRFE